MSGNLTELTLTWLGNKNHSTTTPAAVAKEMPYDISVALWMQRCIFPLLVIFGTIGHVLTLAVLIRPRMRNTSIYFYLMILSCSDAIVLWISCFKVWIRTVSDFELTHVSDSVCKMVTFVYLFSTYLSSWLIVCMTIDRFIAVWFPLQVATLCSIRHAWISTVIMVVLAMLSNVHVFWTFYLYQSRRCTYYSSLFFMKHIFEPLKFASYCFVPFVIVISLNIAIICKLKWRSSFIRRQNTRQGGGSGGSTGHDRIIYLLLTVSFTWFFLTLPVSLLGYVPFLHNNKIATSFCFIFMYTNHSINFYLYCLTGKKFRQELKEVLHCQTVTKGQQQIQNGGEITKSTLKTDVNEKIPLTCSSNHLYSGGEE